MTLSNSKHLPDSEKKTAVRQLWKTCFDDEDDFMELYFSEVYSDENTLICTENNQPVASLQLLPYSFTFYGQPLPVAYISGACTLPEYRRKGYMGRLLSEALGVMQQRNTPLSMLIPAEDWLYDYYMHYGYEKVFDDGGAAPLQLKDFIEQAGGNRNEAYRIFDVRFRPMDFRIQKTKNDFLTILKDAEQMGFPAKENLSGMARIVDAVKLLEIFAQKHPDTPAFSFYLEDSQLARNSGVYEIGNGQCRKIEKSNFDEHTLLSINDLCRLIFGYRLASFDHPLTRYFEPHEPVLNLMLE